MCCRFFLTFGIRADALFSPQTVQGGGEHRFPEDSLGVLER